MKLIGTKIHVESGGIIVADFLDIVVSELVVDDSGQIHTNYKVAVTLLDIQMNLVISKSGLWPNRGSGPTVALAQPWPWPNRGCPPAKTALQANP
jgi:hypothetical protein